MGFILRNGTAVTPDGRVEADLWCDDGRIVGLVPRGHRVEADTSIDATGLLLFPGFIDPHVHSRDPGLTEKEDFEHSTRGAAAGGITTILEMPNTIPPVLTGDVLTQRAEYYSARAWVDFGLWGFAAADRNLRDLAGLFSAGAVGVKLFWGYPLDASTLQLIYTAPTGDVIPAPDAGVVLRVAREVGRLGGLLALHCEDRGILDAAQEDLGHAIVAYSDLLRTRPEVAESAAVAVAAQIAATTRCHIHVVHMSSMQATEIVREARRAGVPLTAETCPHYLTLGAEDQVVIDGKVKVYPPVRAMEHQHALWQGLADGVIESIGSDHAPHTLAEKQRPLGDQPAGMPGVETLGPLLVDAMCRGLLRPEQIAAVLSENPARIYGLYPSKGALAPGSEADITVVDPNASTTLRTSALHAKNPYCPWDGRELQGRVVMTFLRGQQIMRDGQLPAGPVGRFVPAAGRSIPRRGPTVP